jgi:NAD(P)-dependent dehydrogenase (short-subunit alcohol dehydrogenase family)
LAVELAPSNIHVIGIAPGFFRTEMNLSLIADGEFSAWVARRTPAGRWGEPAEIAGAVFPGGGGLRPATCCRRRRLFGRSTAEPGQCAVVTPRLPV